MIAFSILLFSFNVSSKVYLDQNEFIALVDSSVKQKPTVEKWENKTLWLNKEIQKDVIQILDHRYPKLRLRYKIKSHSSSPKDATTIWFLEEIGKERPITFGIAVRNNQIALIKVLEFRESRGYEISIPEFSNQFTNLGLDKNGSLNNLVDGITGATMSVNAMKKISRLAITLHKLVLNQR